MASPAGGTPGGAPLGQQKGPPGGPPGASRGFYPGEKRERGPRGRFPPSGAPGARGWEKGGRVWGPWKTTKKPRGIPSPDALWARGRPKGNFSPPPPPKADPPLGFAPKPREKFRGLCPGGPRGKTRSPTEGASRRGPGALGKGAATARLTEPREDGPGGDRRGGGAGRLIATTGVNEGRTPPPQKGRGGKKKADAGVS